MLKELTKAFAPSGMEDEVRNIVIREISPYCDKVSTDKMGNVIAFKKGRSSSKIFMADAHMDEVGLIVKHITEDGYLKFDEVGGIDERVLPGKRVLVGENKLPGIIGIKALHLASKEEREQVKKMKDLYIDMGFSSREETTKYVAKGDYVCFDSDYVEFGDGLVKAKALDDRVGVAILIDMLKNTQPAYDFYGVFSVQEEIGLRGAKVAANTIQPDFAIILEATICADNPDTPRHLQVTRLGEGAVMSIMERSSLADVEMKKFAEKIAEEEGISYQYKGTGNGGNNAGSIQIAADGVKTLALALPCRYLHSPGGVVSMKDYEQLKQLATKICERMDEICLKN